MTKLVTTETVVSVIPHPNADRLDIIKVLGYDCIVPRGQYKQGELVVLIQPDSILPADREWAAPYLRYCSRGRVRAVRLRGEWSMGLVMPVDMLLPIVSADSWNGRAEGVDYTDYLGVTKYEPAIPKNLQAKGGLPFDIPKTDEERWQNIRQLPYGEEVFITLKIDGCSFTAFCVKEGDQWRTGITSRSLELKTGEGFNSQWHEAERMYNVMERLLAYCREHDVELALRGEVYGEGVQNLAHNVHSKVPRNVAFFSVYDVKARRYKGWQDEHNLLAVCSALELPVVPVLNVTTLTPELIQHYDNGVDTVLGHPFEGVVMRTNNMSFKVINKHYDALK